MHAMICKRYVAKITEVGRKLYAILFHDDDFFVPEN